MSVLCMHLNASVTSLWTLQVLYRLPFCSLVGKVLRALLIAFVLGTLMVQCYH